MTSSPACTVADSAVWINCLAPAPTISSSSPKSNPFSRWNLRRMASSKGRDPTEAV